MTAPIRVAVIDSGSGNLASVRRALDRAAAASGLAIAAEVTGDADAVAAADRVVLPGQGAFAAVMRGLQALPGMIPALHARVRAGTPLLGICVGLQVMAERGLEGGETAGLGWIAGSVARLAPAPDAAGRPLALPQMGWNTLQPTRPAHPLLAGVAAGEHAYFVHSYALTGGDPADVLLHTDYGGAVVAAIARENLAGTQFHVEKSGALGVRLLANFLRWSP